jgi:16S rRNA (cytosine967-C5)-methyltransferase
VTRQPNLPAGNTPHRVAALDAARDGKVRRRILDLYARAAADWARAPGTLAHGFRGARELRSHERRFVGEAVYGMIRWRRRLAFVTLGVDDASPLQLYLAWLRGELGPAPEIDAELRKAQLDPRALDGAEQAITSIADRIERIAVATSYPTWLVQRLADQLGVREASELLSAMNQRAPLTVRANRLKNTREELAELLKAENVGSHANPLASDGLDLETHLNAYGLRAFKDGRFELQDAGSQLIAELTAPPPKGTVVDACAGAGGKTLALGALLGNKGRLYAFDVSDRKLEELRERSRRAGLTNVQATKVEEARQQPADEKLVGRADRVLCDAPCSGVGVLRRNPEARWRLQPRDLDELPVTQSRILDTYAPLVAPGGRLIYATCTVTAGENDQVAQGFLGRHPEFEEVPAKEILGGARARAIGDGQRLRLLPQVHGTDGFFAVVFRRGGKAPQS